MDPVAAGMTPSPMLGSLEVRAHVALAVVAAHRARLTKEILVAFVIDEWRHLEELERQAGEASAAGARGLTRRGPGREGR